MLVGVIDHPEQVLSISSNYGHRQTHLLESIIAFNNPITGEKNLYIDTDKTYHIGFRYCQIHSKANRIDKNLSAISNSWQVQHNHKQNCKTVNVVTQVSDLCSALNNKPHVVSDLFFNPILIPQQANNLQRYYGRLPATATVAAAIWHHLQGHWHQGSPQDHSNNPHWALMPDHNGISCPELLGSEMSALLIMDLVIIQATYDMLERVGWKRVQSFAGINSFD